MSISPTIHPPMPARPEEGRAATGRGTRATPTGADPIAHLITFLSGPNPQLLLVKGAPGAVKSTLLARLAAELQGPRIFIAYRADPATRGAGGTGANEK